VRDRLRVLERGLERGLSLTRRWVRGSDSGRTITRRRATFSLLEIGVAVDAAEDDGARVGRTVAEGDGAAEPIARGVGERRARRERIQRPDVACVT
jgi:hypothetical protein